MDTVASIWGIWEGGFEVKQSTIGLAKTQTCSNSILLAKCIAHGCIVNLVHCLLLHSERNGMAGSFTEMQIFPNSMVTKKLSLHKG